MGGHPGSHQQARQRIGWLDRPLPRGVRVQRQEELAVGEPPGQPVRRVYREGGLADPGHPADRMNANHAAVGGVSGQRPIQPLQLGLPAGEAGNRTRQRPQQNSTKAYKRTGAEPNPVGYLWPACLETPPAPP